MSETIEFGIAPSGNLERLTVSSRNIHDIDDATIGDVSISPPSKGNFASIFDAFKNIDPVAAAALLGIPAIVKALGAGGSGAAASSAIPTPPPGTTTPPPAEPPPAEPPPGTTTPPPGTTTPPPAEPPPAEPPPAEPPPAEPPPAETSPNPTEDELIKAGVPNELIPLLLKYGLGALASYLSYKSAQDARKEARGASFTSRGPVTSTRTTYGGSTYKPAAQGGLMSLAGGGSVNTLREDRLRVPEVYEEFFKHANLRNIPSMYSELPRSKDELEERDSQLYAAFGLPDLASNPPSEALIKLVDEIRNVLNASSTPSPEQISMYEANQLYSPIESVSVAGKEPQLYVSDNYASELSGDLNPMFERELRHWEQTGQFGGGGGEFEKGTGPTDPMSLYSKGGMTTKQPFYLGGPTDGMADEVPAHIDNKRPAALSDGEFVIPADVVSHLGNGNSNAGAKRLYEMMDNIREARTGNKNQGIQINPNQFMPR